MRRSRSKITRGTSAATAKIIKKKLTKMPKRPKRCLTNIAALLLHPLCKKKRRHYREHLQSQMKFSHPLAKVPKIDCKRIPIYIISFNQLSYLKLLIEFLERRGYENIHIIDNCSTYPPLLQYLKETPHTVHNMDKNYGHMVFWASGFFDDVIKNEFYVLTDPDILPSEDCPDDFLGVFHAVLHKMPFADKVGCALLINDLPDGYEKKELVMEWESKFWKHPIKNTMGLEIYNAAIDTTLALYRPDPEMKVKGGSYPWALRSARIAGKFAARHLPWYVCGESEELEFYKRTASNESASWTKSADNYCKK
jgi:hypothetical protein